MSVVIAAAITIGMAGADLEIDTSGGAFNRDANGNITVTGTTSGIPLTFKLDGQQIQPNVAIANDGSWTATFPAGVGQHDLTVENNHTSVTETIMVQ